MVWLIEPVFWSIEHRDSSFFKNSVLTDSNYYFKTSSNFPLSLRLGKAPLKIFCCFPLKFLQGFSLTRPVRPLYPSFCFYFHDFMHKLMHFNGIFGPFQIWGFCWFNASSSFFPEIDHWVLLIYCYIHDLCWLIWSIWGFVNNWKF